MTKTIFIISSFILLVAMLFTVFLPYAEYTSNNDLEHILYGAPLQETTKNLEGFEFVRLILTIVIPMALCTSLIIFKHNLATAIISTTVSLGLMTFLVFYVQKLIFYTSNDTSSIKLIGFDMLKALLLILILFNLMNFMRILKMKNLHPEKKENNSDDLLDQV